MRGYTMTKQQYLARLRRIEGQVLGLQRQIEEDTYCIDVLQQIAAVNGALQNVAIGLLDEHVGHCVANAAAAGDQNKARDMVTEATQPSPGSSRPDARPTHGIRNSRRTPVGTPGAAVMDRSCGAGGRATVRERRYAEALRGSRAARTRSRPKMNSSAGS